MLRGAILEKNIEKLTKSRTDFMSYVDKSYNQKNKKGEKVSFPNSSYYFHNRVLNMVRNSKDYDKLLNDTVFLEFIYATLSTWGMDRMEKRAVFYKVSSEHWGCRYKCVQRDPTFL